MNEQNKNVNIISKVKDRNIATRWTILIMAILLTSCSELPKLKTNNYFYSRNNLETGIETGYNKLLYFVSDSMFYYSCLDGMYLGTAFGSYKTTVNQILLYPSLESKHGMPYTIWKDSITLSRSGKKIIFENDTLAPRRRKVLGYFKNHPPKNVLDIIRRK